jgi:hypothetical protein
VTPHPDLDRPFGSRPVIGELVSKLADKHKLLVHSVLRSNGPQAVMARANLCHLLIERCWVPDAIDRWFGFPAGTALDGKAKWKAKIARDEARRIEAEAFLAAGEGLPPIRERMAQFEREAQNAERMANYHAAKERRPAVLMIEGVDKATGRGQ